MDTRLDVLLCDLLTADDWELGRLVGRYECRSDAMTIGSMTLYSTAVVAWGCGAGS